MPLHSNWYDRDGEPIDVSTVNTLLGDPDYKRVTLTEITSATDPGERHLVSTVWLGLDHSFHGGEPIIFETMVFRGPDDFAEELGRRYATEQEAKAGHAETVTLICATIPDEQIKELRQWPADH